MRQGRKFRRLQKLRKWEISKKRAQREHAKRRALQRFDFDISSSDLKQIVKDIQDQKAKFIKRQSVRVTIWELEYKGKSVRVVYDSKRKEIVTFLPEGQREMINELVKKWDQTGLLKNLDEEQQKEMAQKLESLATEILQTKPPRGMVNVMFPLQRKLMEHQISLVDGDLLIGGKKFMTIEEFSSRRDKIVQDDEFPHGALDREVDFVNIVFEEMRSFIEEQKEKND